MGKKIISICFSILPLVVLPATANAEDPVGSGYCGKDGENITWSIDSFGNMTLK